MAKTVNSLLFLSQVSHLFNKCTGLCPCPYFISPIRTTSISLCILIGEMAGAKISAENLFSLPKVREKTLSIRDEQGLKLCGFMIPTP